ncbi:hypothetical protein P1X15_03650 [Runella sp. MFBS21]|uniref:hypothetical protein n=1 Tax=Runella sp. MFBS21 TaxID=3034018 RepID=UPI0023F66845|nr:hypothetical protein [Runella sp. MFBS21]MDF7816670.1 hypothetical protein [Runella sp. MFBS21]
MSQESSNERFNRIRREIGTLLSFSSRLNDLARDNLIYWLTGSGATSSDYPTDAFQRSSVVNNELETTHLRRLKTGILRRLQASSNEIFPSGVGTSVSFLGGNEFLSRLPNQLKNNRCEEFYIESSIGFDSFLLGLNMDLAYAFGGLSILSKIQVRLLEFNQTHPENSRIRIERWRCKIYDEYDWDIGKQAFLFGFGISDADMVFYRQYSRQLGNPRGENYTILSREWIHTSPYNFTTVESLDSYWSRINPTSIH